MKNPIVTIKVKAFGKIKIELYPEIAPSTVENFLKYSSEDFYKGLKFHRIISGFMIQGGGNELIKTMPIIGEFNKNGFENQLKHEKGIISMARTNDPNSATSQFFIMHETSPHLDGAYAAFGKTIAGIEIVDQIAGVKTNSYDEPISEVIIEEIEVELNGYIPTKIINYKN